MQSIPPEPNPAGIIAFMKVFDVQEYAEAFFLRGRIHMKTADRFRRMEDDGTGRADPRDSVDHIYQPNLVNLFWRLPSGREVMLPKPSAIEDRDDTTSDSHMFCSYMITNRHLERARAGLSILDHRIAHLGRFAVLIHRPDTFLEQIDARIDREGVASRRAPVEYVDIATQHGEVGPFKKDTRFSYQHEYRIVVEPSGEDFLDLEVGALTDIALCLPCGDGLDGLLSRSLIEARALTRAS